MIQEGTILNGTYVIQKPLGSGGGGSIYLAYHNRLQKHVAIKKIHEVGMVPEEILRREADILKNLRHSYLPQVFDFLVMPSGVYTVMDYIPGWSLKELLDSGHKFSEKEIVKYGTQLCEALSYLHSQNPAIIHGDIKPANIMVTPEGNITLIDFNISAFTRNDGKAYTFGYSAGYAAPEQYREYQRLYGNPNTTTESSAEAARGIPIDYRTDIYSVGATLYHMLTGMKITKAPEGQVVTDAGNGLVFILNKALSANPAKRYANAGQMLNAFRSIYKLDKRYKQLEARRTVMQIVFILLAAVGVVMLYLGVRKGKTDLVAKYDKCIEDMIEAREDGDVDAFEQYYEEALEINSERVEAYVERADLLFELQEYSEDIVYIEKHVLTTDGLEFSSDIGYVYYMLGLCYFETEDYSNAITAYRNALKYDKTDGNIYVQYAISLARTGELDKAVEALDDAKKNGASNALVDLTEGEIKIADGDYEGSIEHFDNAIAASENEYVLMRAYVMKAEAYKKIAAGAVEAEAVENYRKAGDILDEAVSKLSSSYKNSVLQREAQCYIDAYNISADADDAHKAIAALQGIIDTGYAEFSVYDNIVILHQNCGELDEAADMLAKMKDKYSDYYAYYKRMAFQEILVQNQAAAGTASYAAFDEYYSTAQELYAAGNNVDMEMNQLESLYNDLVARGLL
ncbi:MAG: protein kinase [Lachnospiraceae bacterium]|nr:protein kinase [Lachnospiraceae bacterium]